MRSEIHAWSYGGFRLLLLKWCSRLVQKYIKFKFIFAFILHFLSCSKSLKMFSEVLCSDRCIEQNLLKFKALNSYLLCFTNEWLEHSIFFITKSRFKCWFKNSIAKWLLFNFIILRSKKYHKEHEYLNFVYIWASLVMLRVLFYPLYYHTHLRFQG